MLLSSTRCGGLMTVKMPSGIIILWIACMAVWTTIDGFHCRTKYQKCSRSFVNRYRGCPSSGLSPLQVFNYGRGADIWPETNEDPIQLQDSFPNGHLPYSAIIAMDFQDMAVVHDSFQNNGSETANVESKVIDPADDKQNKRGSRFFVSKTVRRLLRRAAAREELDSEQAALDATPGIWDKSPAVIAVMLLVKGLIRPLDIIWVSSLSAYFIILNMVARSPRESGLAPIMPVTPPQGHVPTMVSNPLGIGTLYSTTYDLWLKVGVLLGMVAPLAQAAVYTFRQSNVAAARLCARPVFLLCFQALAEAYSRQAMAPLPIRISIPVLYNAARLGYLYMWACTTAVSLGWVGRSLAIANLAYWGLNLFAFLIPVAVIRYMRAYFFGVEASEVTTRLGMEDTIGLVPNPQ